MEKIHHQKIQEYLSLGKKIVQLTSFGPTGLVILELLSQLNLLPQIPICFIDTLYHFPETYELVEKIKERYPEIQLITVKPKKISTREEFEAQYGPELWLRQPERYAYYTKIEPRNRIMNELGASIYINGRRKSQGGERSQISLTEEQEGCMLIQPCFEMTEEEIWQLIHQYDLTYNSLHDRGYRSIGDYHSTFKTEAEATERAGRVFGHNKTECGLYLNPS